MFGTDAGKQVTFSLLPLWWRTRVLGVEGRIVVESRETHDFIHRPKTLSKQYTNVLRCVWHTYLDVTVWFH